MKFSALPALLLLVCAPALAKPLLKTAIAQCNTQETQKLLESGADPNAVDSSGPVTRWLASGKCSDEEALATARLLLDHGARFDGYPKAQGPSLLVNLAHRRLPMTLALLCGAILGGKHGIGNPTEALESIATKDDVESVAALLMVGADPLDHALLAASRSGRGSAVAEMLKHVKDKSSPEIQKAFLAGEHFEAVKNAFLAAGIQAPAKPVERVNTCALKPMSDAQTQLMKKLIGVTSACSFVQRCGDLVHIDCGAAVDGPAYYVDEKAGKIVSTCGGACMSGCTDCPPKAWTCTCQP